MLWLASAGCARQSRLSAFSRFTVSSRLNDSVWYGSGQLLRLKAPNQRLDDIRQVNLLVYTDIDYPGMGSGPNTNTNNGCVDPECTRTQILMIYNIPLKKGRTSMARLNQRGQPQESTHLSYVGNAGGLTKRYVYQGLKPGWVKVTKVDRVMGMVEGRFSLSLSEDKGVYNRLQNGMPETARFRDGYFRVKITDVTLK
ncbi:hypothetical protein GCM10028773_24220 [Spirosoma koreense]